MAAPIPLRTDYDGETLRRLAEASTDANQTRRLLPLAVIQDGGRRGIAATVAGVGLQVIRDWVPRFNAKGPGGLIDGKAPGQAPKLNAAQRQALARLVDDGPVPAVHGVVRWRLKDLAQWVYEEFDITLDETTIGRTLRAMGFRKLSARPRHHAQNELRGYPIRCVTESSWHASATGGKHDHAERQEEQTGDIRRGSRRPIHRVGRTSQAIERSKATRWVALS